MSKSAQNRALIAIDGNWDVTIMPIARESPLRIELADGGRYEVRRSGEIVRITGGHIYQGALASAVLIAALDSTVAMDVKTKVDAIRADMINMGARLKPNPYVDTVEAHLSAVVHELRAHAAAMASTKEREAQITARDASTWRGREETLMRAEASIKGDGHE